MPQTATRTPRQSKTSCTHAIDEVCSVSRDLHTVYPTSVVLTGSPSCGGDVTVYVYDKSQQSLPTPFYSVLVSVFVFMALSTVFHSIHSPDNSPFSHSVLPVLSLCLIASFNYISLHESLPYWSFQLYISL